MSPLSDAILTRLEQVVGKEHCSTDGDVRRWFSSAGVPPQAVVSPERVEQIVEIVRLAGEHKLCLVPCGDSGPHKLPWKPARYDIALRMRRMKRVLAYDPGDLTLGVEAGIDPVHLEATLAEQKQFLPLAWGETVKGSTMGERIAANSSGPLRHGYGTARDYLLGMEYVTGDGKFAKSGGRVVKNVAGYDIHKLFIGSFGTLAVITGINFRTFPLPRVTATFLLEFPNMAAVLAFRRALAESVLQPRGVELISPEAARLMRWPDPAVRMPRFSEKAWTAAISVGGNEGVVERHRKDLRMLGDAAGSEAFREHTGEEERWIWAWVRNDLIGSVKEPTHAVVRFSAVPSTFAAVLELAKRVAEIHHVPVAAQVRAAGLIFVNVGCGLSDATALPRVAAACNDLAAQAPRAGTTAVVYFCVPELVQQMNVWGSVGGDVELMRKLKQVFDPQNILSPGRFYGGI